MALSDTVFNALADLALNRLFAVAEALDDDGDLEVDLVDGVLSVVLPSGRQFIVNRHLPTQELWLSSPLSGGLHFRHDDKRSAWVLVDGRQLDTLLKAEIETLLDEEEED